MRYDAKVYDDFDILLPVTIENSVVATKYYHFYAVYILCWM